jgi:GT2 family glycosyltransferase
MSSGDVTIVVVPRERFSEAPQSLDSLLRNTAPPFSMVYIDGGSPRRVRRCIDQRAREYGFRVVRSRRYLSPNEARNIGLQHVATRYVAFTDNDLHVRPGWLERLVACAEETGASLVGPLYHQVSSAGELIHMAGGDAAIEVREGRRSLRQGHHLSAAATDAARGLTRRPTELVEFHCMLARSDALRRLGGLDPKLLSTPEHIDLCLGVQAAGGAIYLEPEAKVTYMGPGPLSWYDLPYFLLRWSDEWTGASLRHFRDKWRLAKDDAFLREHASWIHDLRVDVSYRWRSPLRRIFGSRSAHQVEPWLERRVARWCTRGNRPGAVAVHENAGVGMSTVAPIRHTDAP